MAEVNNRDVAAEKAVLAGLFRYGGQAWSDVADILTSKTFTLDTSQLLFTCFEHIFTHDASSKVDLASIISASTSMNCQHLFENEKEKQYIKAIMAYPVDLSNVRKLAQKIRKLEIARDYYEALRKSYKNVVGITGDETISNIISQVEQPIYNLTEKITLDTGTEGSVSMGSSIEDYVAYLAENPVDHIGIPTGFDIFDEAIGGGLRRQTVNCVGARPKTGKTFLGDNIGFYVASTLNIPVLNCQTEMSHKDHQNRLLGLVSGVPFNKIEKGWFAKNPTELKKVQHAAKHIASVPYRYQDIRGKSIDEQFALMRRWIIQEVGVDKEGKTKDCLLIYDYIKLMSDDTLKNMQEYQALGFLMTNLHNFAGKYDIPILALMQINRDGINKEDTDVAAGSDRIIWLCSNFSILKDKSPEEIDETGDENGNKKIVPIVQRHGAGLSDGDYINVQADLSVSNMKEINTRYASLKKQGKQVQTTGEILADDVDSIPFD